MAATDRRSPSPPPPPGPHDPAHVVEGASDGRHYFCPTVASVDAHIVELRARMAKVGRRFPKLVEDWAADIDLLLDHRSFMTFPVLDSKG